MNKEFLKRTLPVIVFILFLIPVATSSLLDLEQKKANELISQRQKAEEEAEDRIYLMGKFDPAQRDDFILIPVEYTTDGNKKYLRKETYGAYLEMQKIAKMDGVELKIASATRNFDYQKNIWNNKWNSYTLVDDQYLSKTIPDGLEIFKKILEYSAVPGTSRHHFGTDIDINNANPQYFNEESGKKVYDWLTKNAPLFGFCQTYNLKGSERLTGYNEEKWHWSYLPIAKELTQKYKKLIKEEDIKGFLGEEYVPFLNLINDYVLSINPDCI